METALPIEHIEWYVQICTCAFFIHFTAPSSHLPPRRGMGYTNIFRRCDARSPQARRTVIG